MYVKPGGPNARGPWDGLSDLKTAAFVSDKVCSKLFSLAFNALHVAEPDVMCEASNFVWIVKMSHSSKSSRLNSA